MDTLALTDRDGVYGAVKFARAARSAGVRPVLGVDLAVEPTGLLSPPPMVHPSLRRAARGGRPGGSSRPRAARRSTRGTRGSPCWPGTRPGWAALCRLVSATHLRGERGKPVSTLDLVAEHVRAAAAAGGGLLVLLGPGSEVGRALTARRPDLARAVLARWRERGRADRPGARGGLAPRARRPAPGRPDARAGGRGAAHRGAHQRGALRRPRPTPRPSTCSTPSRRLVPLDPRHVDRVNAEGYLKSGKEMARGRRGGRHRRGAGRPGGPPAARRDPAGRRPVRGRPAGRPRHGRGALPRPATCSAGRRPTTRWRPRRRCCGSAARAGWAGGRWPPPREVRRRLDDELAIIE